MAIVAYALAAISLIWLALFLAGKRICKIWLLALGVLPVILIYILNPEFRVYSFHSFMHAGITYQILNGNIPPPDPLLAGHTVAYPWGAHLLAAGLSKALNVTPFMSMAIMNVLSLGLVMLLVYRISKVLVDDERANVLSVVVSVYGITFTNPSLMRLVGRTVPTEFRGVPILLKFITINMVPIGLVFFLLFVYAMLELGRADRLARSAVLLLVAMLGVGYTYPAFLPSIGASLGLTWLASLALYNRRADRWSLKTLVAAAVALAVTVLIVRSYLEQTGGGTLGKVQILSRQASVGNIVKYFIVTLPVLVIMGVNARAFGRADRRALLFLAAIVVATMAVYVAIHLPLDNEYKLLLLSTVTLGILGGVAFAHLAGRLRGYKTVVVFVLLAVFLFPSFRFVKLKLVQERAGRPSQAFVERGRSTRSTDREADEFYQWIKANTGNKSVLIDQELDAPVLAERTLFIGLGKREPGQQKGYGPVDMILRLQSGYPADLLDMRRRIIEKIYAPNPQLAPAEREELTGLPGALYVIWRAGGTSRLPESPTLEEVFASGSGNFRLYRFRPSTY